MDNGDGRQNCKPKCVGIKALRKDVSMKRTVCGTMHRVSKCIPTIGGQAHESLGLRMPGATCAAWPVAPLCMCTTAPTIMRTRPTTADRNTRVLAEELALRAPEPPPHPKDATKPPQAAHGLLEGLRGLRTLPPRWSLRPRRQAGWARNAQKEARRKMLSRGSWITIHGRHPYNSKHD